MAARSGGAHHRQRAPDHGHHDKPHVATTQSFPEEPTGGEEHQCGLKGANHADVNNAGELDRGEERHHVDGQEHAPQAGGAKGGAAQASAGAVGDREEQRRAHPESIKGDDEPGRERQGPENTPEPPEQ